MSIGPQDINFAHWTVEQKISLMEQLWESLPHSTELVPAWQLQSVAQRIAKADANQDEGISWEELKTRFKAIP